MPTPYDRAFFDEQGQQASRSAEVVVPLVLDLVQPRSVVDVGCGGGAWLRAFSDRGVGDYLGIDGDYVERASLLIPEAHFRSMDLANPVPLARVFDVATCLEVGEHLPTASAESLIRFLTNAAPIVVFSAAIPGQGGTAHINEQWPQFWRDLFAARGYQRLDPIRRLILGDPRVEWWYQQNLFVFASEGAIKAHPKLSAGHLAMPLELIHSDLLKETTRVRTLSELVKALPAAIRRAVTSRQ